MRGGGLDTLPRLLTVKEAAKLLRVSMVTVRRWIYAGKLSKAVRTDPGRCPEPGKG